ncbi:hypothetical protein GCM10011610_21190 [Nocardia rhizosphaerihabitans]|uniref:Uncharacterized protein n=1 Tax=Nocardia rhizosphaerihabitans TaxID=1691570 RepID=A0ABQ2K9L7_9NOCA|nr:hypothetical protein GCM10011610_21190 [Nocardia rhizosphaerihabitans]
MVSSTGGVVRGGEVRVGTGRVVVLCGEVVVDWSSEVVAGGRDSVVASAGRDSVVVSPSGGGSEGEVSVELRLNGFRGDMYGAIRQLGEGGIEIRTVVEDVSSAIRLGAAARFAFSGGGGT